MTQKNNCCKVQRKPPCISSTVWTGILIFHTKTNNTSTTSTIPHKPSCLQLFRNTDRQTGEPARRQWYTQADGHGDSPACARAGIPAAKRTRQCGRRDACRENKLKYNEQKDKEA